MEQTKTNTNDRPYVCKRLRLHNYLNDNGFREFQTRRDKYNNMYIVWIYENSKELQNTVNEYYMIWNKINKK